MKTNKKKLAVIIVMLICCVIAVSAQSKGGEDFGLNARVKMILDILNSAWVKGIACIAFVIECILLITAGRQEPGMFKKFIPWIAGTLLFMSAGTITNKFMNKSSFDEIDLSSISRIETLV